MWARSMTEAKGLIKGEVRKHVGIEAVRGAASLKLDRLELIFDNGAEARMRRDRGRAGWRERRNYRGRCEGFARGHHFNHWDD